MVSIKAMAECIGLEMSEEISIVKDFFGYTQAPEPLSLKTQVSRLQNLRKHFHINCILVGTPDHPRNASQQQQVERQQQEIDIAVHTLRDIYANYDVGVGRVRQYEITDGNANGRSIIDDNDEAKALTEEWTFPGDALDVFFVQSYVGEVCGYSPYIGTCDKNFGRFTGCVIELSSGRGGGVGSYTPQETTGLVLAHEIGHYFGLAERLHNPNNLMYQELTSGTELDDAQTWRIKTHCFMRSSC
jgi:hypothetical protein